MSENLTWQDELPFRDFSEVFSKEFFTVMETVDNLTPLQSLPEMSERMPSLANRLLKTYEDGALWESDYNAALSEFKAFSEAFAQIISGEKIGVFDSKESALMAIKLLPVMQKFLERMKKEREGMKFDFRIIPDEEM